MSPPASGSSKPEGISALAALSSFLLFASLCFLVISAAKASALSSFLCFAASLFPAIHSVLMLLVFSRQLLYWWPPLLSLHR